MRSVADGKPRPRCEVQPIITPGKGHLPRMEKCFGARKLPVAVGGRERVPPHRLLAAFGSGAGHLNVYTSYLWSILAFRLRISPTF